MVKYSTLGTSTRLRDLVFAGSHDAAITEGGENARTQKMEIGDQARAGVRLFDLRIKAVAAGKHTINVGNFRGSTTNVEFRAYHGHGFKGSVSKKKLTWVNMPGGVGGFQRDIKVKKLRGGVWGQELSGILDQAGDFVDKNPDEFLILKFDKCHNWGLIANACMRLLGDYIYTAPRGSACLNTKTLRNLKGKVICVFSEKGAKELNGSAPDEGVLYFRNLNGADDVKSYSTNFDGLQYFGKGGTSLLKGSFKGYSGKVKLNVKKQSKLMDLMASANSRLAFSSDVLGMMYWTSTGVFENIEARNDLMWSKGGMVKMRDLWLGGLHASIKARCDADRIKATHYSSGSRLKAFIPNIVMVDFADADKCEAIFDLNKVAATTLTSAYSLASKHLL